MINDVAPPGAPVADRVVQRDLRGGFGDHRRGHHRPPQREVDDGVPEVQADVAVDPAAGVPSAPRLTGVVDLDGDGVLAVAQKSGDVVGDGDGIVCSFVTIWDEDICAHIILVDK